MKKIKLLSENLINKIAAGEVLERPASAVKELIENSLDANAKKIDIHVRDSGKTEIIVIDDGCGINANELSLSVQRHATSKLNDENLFAIKSFGFRGEALPSIASVSKLKITSKSEEDKSAYEILIDSGKIIYNKPTARNNGTTVIIKDIFYTTPARLKFLKTEKYENILIKRIVQKLALSNTQVEFKLTINDKALIKTSYNNGDSDIELLKKRVIDIFGSDFNENLIEINQKRDELNFTGLISLPTFHHSNSNNQFIFVNKRSINDKLLNSTVKAAYRDFLSYDRFPQVIIFIDAPYFDVDINVHPTKSEVKFKDQNKLRSALISSIKTSLSNAGHRASSTNTIKAVESFKSSNRTFDLSSFKHNKNQKFEKNNINVVPELEFNEDEKKNEIDKNIYPLGYAKSQYHQTFIISQTKDGIIIVDQHAAHERIVYEKLKRDFFNKAIQTQILLIPEIINGVDNLVIDLIANYKTLLKRYGLYIEKFGKDSILVREVPFILSNSNIKQLVLDTITELSDIGSSEIIETNIHRICSSMACHGSIRAGREMKIEEMNNLLRNMESTPFSGQCNHGRPTYVELKLNDIEKLFGRK